MTSLAAIHALGRRIPSTFELDLLLALLPGSQLRRLSFFSFSIEKVFVLEIPSEGGGGGYCSFRG